MIQYIIMTILLVTPLFAQTPPLENPTNTTAKYYSNWRDYSKYSRVPSKPPHIGIYTRIEGVSDKELLSTTGLEWKAGRSIYYYGQLRYSRRIAGSGVLPTNIQNTFSVNNFGILHGLGGYLFDKRTEETGIGWSMVMNGAAGIEIAVPNNFELVVSKANLFTIVSEINTYVRYHFHKTHAVQLGINVGVDFSLSQLPYKNIKLETPFRYGFGVGFAF